MIRGERKNIFWIWLLAVLVQMPGYAQTRDPSAPRIEVGAAYGAIGPMGDLRDNVESWSFKNKGLLLWLSELK